MDYRHITWGDYPKDVSAHHLKQFCNILKIFQIKSHLTASLVAQ